MKYTVTWKPDAEAELAAIWNAATDRSAIAQAANKIDHLLATNPAEQGESRTQSIRILFVEPIGIFFDVNDADLLVSVLRVWTIA